MRVDTFAFAADVYNDFVLAYFDYLALDDRAGLKFGETAVCEQFFHYVTHLLSLNRFLMETG